MIMNLYKNNDEGIYSSRVFFNYVSKTFWFDEDEYKQFEYNWIGHLISMRGLRDIYALWKKGDNDAVKQCFYKHFSDENTINELIHDFDENEIFSPRMHIISKALKAHLNSDYELSIPVLLAQIDGIFIEKYNALDGKIKYTSRCPECGHKMKTELRLNATNISQHNLKKETSARRVIYFPEHIIKIFRDLRNDILHGKNLDYADKNLSTKLIITLIELSLMNN